MKASTVFPYILIRTAGWSLPDLSIKWPDESKQKIKEERAAAALQQAFDATLATLPDSPQRTAVYNTRKRFFQKKQLPPEGWEELFQENSLPAIQQLLTCLQDVRASQIPQNQILVRLEEGLVQNWRIIQQAAANPDFQKALLFASHDLLNRIPGFCGSDPEDFTAKDRQAGLALLQYLTRGAYKTSPLSRFTTVSVWPWQQFPTPPDEEMPAFMQVAKAAVTPNVALLPALYEVLLLEPAFYNSLSLSLNPCITEENNNANGRQWLYFDGEQESFQQIGQNAAVEAIIRIFLKIHQPISFSFLLSKIAEEISAEENLLSDLIHELVSLGLLFWNLPERGLTPGWCGGLYNYLGHLPMRPVISEAAALLQWLRTAARTLPFQSLMEAQVTQRQTVDQVRAFFERYNSPVPPITSEQVFFEDVEKPASTDAPESVVRQLVADLSACWQQSAPQQLSSFRTALHAFTAAEMAPGESRPFLDFCKKFLIEKSSWEQQAPLTTPPFQGKKGALMQVFKKPDGTYGAVINGLFQGGGKLMARWLHLFSTDFRDALQAWFPEKTLAFPWQGWSNANFQPPLVDTVLQVPDGRVVGKEHSLQLGNLEVHSGANGPFLVDRLSKRPIVFTDLGLESPTTRPPAMQVLWHLGMPAVSLESLWPTANSDANWTYRPRVEFQNLVFRRATWRFAPDIWQKWLPAGGKLAERLLYLRQTLQAQELPQRFFLRFYPGKPQYIDRDSPISLLLMDKMLRTGKGDLWLVEMLPDGDGVANEWVVEWQ